MKISIVNTLPVPSGQASVNRLLSYSKGLVEIGNQVTVLSSAYGEQPFGDIDGVKYYNYGKESGTVSLVKALFMIVKKIWTERYDAVILVSNSLLLIYPIVLFCKLRGSKIIQEKSEFPFVLMQKGSFNKIWAAFYISTTYKLFDGLIVMTSPLMDYFKNKTRKSCKLIEIPMTVDMQRFEIEKNPQSTFGNYIAYCGDMAGNKDGVANLIEAFVIAARTVKDVKLLLIGGTSSESEFLKLKELAQRECPERIVFYGRADREEIPRLLTDAQALALARPSSLQSTGGFPTKLGEYLSTANPVVVTAVGDIPRYLNEKNSFIVEPDNNEAFGKQFEMIFNDYSMAQSRGLEGRKVAEQNFNYKVQSLRIHNYIKGML